MLCVFYIDLVTLNKENNDLTKDEINFSSFLINNKSTNKIVRKQFNMLFGGFQSIDL